jgi:outer membrane protein assembly factor BamB
MSDNPFVPKPPAERTFRPRIWPGVLVLVVSLTLLIAPAFLFERSTAQFMLLMVGAMVASTGGFAWWAAVSRVGIVDRVLALALYLLPAAGFAVEESLDAPGQPPMGVMLYGIPFVFLLWVGGLVIGIPFPGNVRRVVMYLALLLGWLAFGTVRIEGTSSSLVPELSWRWSKKPEDAAKDIKRETVDVKTDVKVSADDWAEFRGPNRDNKISGVTLVADWTAAPKKAWEVDVGPGWGSFTVAGDRLYTMEQQGNDEAVICLDATTGKSAWKRPHTYPAFFKEKISGAGPRSTPTVKDGKVYTFGATAQLCCLDATTGEKVWQIDAREATKANPPSPFWGYASSPLVTRGLVVVCVPDKGTAAFSAKDGSLVWTAGKATHGYGSAQLTTIGGVEQLLMMSNRGLESFDPESGKLLWEHVWLMPSGNRSLQPVVVGEGDFLVTSGVGAVMGTRRVKVTKDGEQWEVSQQWETDRKFSPYFNDGVVYQGYFYGFSGANFICVDLATGKLKWDEGSRHGNGQVLLFADAGQLLVTSEYDKMFLVKCNPADYEEEANAPTVPGKMWNHAAYSRGKLYVRSDRKAACMEMPVASKK